LGCINIDVLQLKRADGIYEEDEIDRSGCELFERDGVGFGRVVAKVPQFLMRHV
jgi:hypothetical protein